MQDAIRVLAGDCTLSYDGEDRREQRGAVVVLVKPDNTVLAHDAGGYQPAAWLTRPDTVSFARDSRGFRLTARKGGDHLTVESHEEYGHAHYPASPAGPPVGACPDCGATLVRDGGRVVCAGCLAEYSIPRDAEVLDATCGECGLPTVRARRGATLEVCLDYTCESLAGAVAERFDGEWDCPDCGSALSISHDRGIRAVCGECGAAFAVPTGTVAGTCPECGLPTFEDGDGPRCLDGECPRP
jgi:DNA topoisomerase-1